MTPLPSSLNRRLGGRFALALVVCALAVTAVVLFGLRRHAETQARARLEPQGVAIAEVLLRKARSIAGLVQSLAATAAIEDDDQRLRRLIPALLADGDANSLIAGGGLWPEPFARDPARQRDCLFWGRQADGRLRFFDDYNHPDKPDYHLDAWYVPARTLAPGHCIWSQGYTDPHSHEPMVTCSAPYFRDGRLAGVVTVDVRLSGLDRLARSLEQPLGGCLRITDRDGHLLSEPRQPLLDDGNPHLRPLHAAFAAGGAAEVRPGSRLYQQIGAQVPVHPGQLIELPHDPRLGKAALVQHLVVPEVGWHLFLAIPRDRALAEAHRFTLVIALTLAGLVVVGLLTAYLATQALVTKPLMRLAAGIRQSGDRPLAGDVASLAQRGDELGAVVCWIVARDAQLLEARRAAEAAAAAKASFLANMSHEIRTPLNGMLGMAQLLQHTRLDGEQEDLVRTILGSGGSLLSVINDILDFSGLDAGARTLVIEPFDLRGMVHDIVDLFRAQPNERLVDLLVDIDPTVPQRLLGDPARVRQIITNLLGNARKFTERGHVLVHARHVDGNLELAVADTGVGIPEDRRHQLFLPFSQLDTSHTRRFGGSGLGLAICLRLCALMGGSISVTSRVGEGSTFTVHLPLPPATGVPVPPAADLRTRQILVVGSRAYSRDLVAAQVRRTGATVSTCADADAAWIHLGSTPCDLVLIEIADDLDRVLAFTRQVRADPARRSVRLVALATIGVRNDAGLVQQAGCDGYLVKPVPDDLLEQVLGTCLARTPDPAAPLVTRHLLREALRLPQPPQRPRYRVQVLVAEDDEVNSMTVCALLGLFGIEPVLVDDGQQAVAQAAANRFDLILMDCQMPVMDGFAAATAIRAAEPPGQHVPIVAVSADVLPDDRARSLAAGMDEHLPKPLMENALAQTLARWCQNKAE